MARLLPGKFCLLALLVPLAALAGQHGAPPAPTGHDLYALSASELEAYVGGFHDGQAALAQAIGMQPLVCVDAGMTRSDLARLVLQALPRLPGDVVALPARDVVLRVLLENAHCPNVEWRR